MYYRDMVESFINKRVKFPLGKQRLFILSCTKKLKLSNSQLSRLLNINIRTLTDWKREKFLMSLTTVRLLSKKSKIRLPSNIKIRDKFWYVTKGAQKGGLAVYKKYSHVGGDPNYRKKKWKEWWDKKGKFEDNPIFRRKIIKRPIKNSKLAEFVGIMMGDGGITQSQITITLNKKDDLSYSRFVAQLIYQLFKVKPSINYNKKFQFLNIVVSRVELVQFCYKIGLPIGNKLKQGLDIPKWIKKNKQFQKACLRGLIDTDGCLVIHKYKVNNKLYIYKKINFSSASPPLIRSVIAILKKFDFNPRMSHNGRNVWIDSQYEVKRYFEIIGSSNPKHHKRLLRRGG